ncbi:MAG: TIGR00159 family protein [Acidobacteria bacterium]|nr:MAG: TIGR00159 family protein [Acidobacteriota bacterium]RLE24869.1 MAG: TIGR00159 family protein [Acidobacteriota bacterium]
MHAETPGGKAVVNLGWLPFRIPGIIDIIDIVVISFVIYKLLVLIRGTRAVQMLIGIISLLLISYVSGIMGLITVKTMVDYTIAFLPVAIIVLFQNEIRKILARMGTNPILQFNTPTRGEAGIEQIVKAAEILSHERKGALIILQQIQGLGHHIETGIRMDARISYDLLINIFEPKTPLHDGAVIIIEDRIAAAGCLLPLSGNPNLPPHFGTRHRAGVGITEETDCVSVIVSEETGKISFAKNGMIMHYKDTSLEGMTRHLEGLLKMDLKNAPQSRLLALWGKLKKRSEEKGNE